MGARYTGRMSETLTPQTVLEFQHECATRLSAETGVPVAAKPKWEVYGRCKYAGRLAVDTEAITDFMTEQGADPAMLQSMYIRFHAGPFAFVNEGGLAREPVQIGDELRYPAIAIGLYRPLASPNSTLRHELRHTLQPLEQRSLYQHPRAGLCMRLGAGAVAAGAIAAAYTGALESRAACTIAGVSSAMMVMPTVQVLLWPFSKAEFTANRFAWQHRNFRPITLRG